MAALAAGLLVCLVAPVPAGAAGSVLQPSASLQSSPATATTPRPGYAHRNSHRLLVPDAEKLTEKKREAWRRHQRSGAGPAFGPSPGPGVSAPATAGSTFVFNGLNQPGLDATDPANQGTPPDTTGAIGPSHYLEFVNSKVAVYSASDLSSIAQRNLDAFVGKSGDNVFDVQIQWDPQGNRWLYLADDINPANQDFLVFGWSKTPDPSDLVNGWCRFQLSTDVGARYLEDYPKLGHSNNHIIFGTNSFRNGLSLQTAHIYAAPKPAAGVTTCSAPTVFSFGSPTSPLVTSDGDPAFTPVPANTTDSTANGYVVAADYFALTTSQIMAWHVAGSPGSPTLTQDGNMNVTAYDVPANVPQPGTSNVLDSMDTRLTQAVTHADPDAGGGEAVWTQHTVDGPGGRSVDRWYELLPATDTVRQEGTIEDSTNFVFNGAISPTIAGNAAAVFYNVGGDSLLAQIRGQSRTSTTPLGVVGGEIGLGVSANADVDFSCTSPYGPPCRWGDYSGASPDPSNPGVVWGSNQINGPDTTDPQWATRNFAVLAGAPYPRPVGATPLRVSLVPAFQPCEVGSANSRHGSPLAFPSCSAPIPSSATVRVGPNGLGFARIVVCPTGTTGAFCTPAGGAMPLPDVRFTGSIRDVKCAPTLPGGQSACSGPGVDYSPNGDPGPYTSVGGGTGAPTPPCFPSGTSASDCLAGADLTEVAELPGASLGGVGTQFEGRGVRITDSSNGPSDNGEATVTDIGFPVPLDCLPTADPTQGSACGVNTTANALAPGVVQNGEAAIWQLGEIELEDSGPDGVRGNADDQRFAVQGIFAP